MFLKNFKYILNCMMGTGYSPTKQPVVTWGGASSETTFYNGSFSRAAGDGLFNIMNNIPDVSTLVKDGVSGKSQGYGVVFGTGTTAPALDDHCLSGTAIDNLTSANVTYTKSYTEGDTYKSVTYEYTISNTTGADITIGEIGLLYVISAKKTSSGSNYYYPVLFERTVLDSPITIANGGVGRVKYTIRMNYPV